MRQLALLLSIFLTAVLLPNQSSFAENSPIPPVSDKPLELNLLTNPTGSVVTANTIYQEHLTVPSLWLAKENSENKLLDNWIAYPVSSAEPARVDLIVNQQIWSLLDYLERYDFVNRLGTVARNYGYNVRVFNYQQERLATYTCNFSASPAMCRIDMNLQSKLGLQTQK
ncbi:hypothetical protein WA1_38445 [Scytonema hofmannii PCC 7110]|uniref:Uncharacterized protein n=1 Tax=Scytonema hofmannii PCC 7110 TaxID=128403 RepID=A0A139X0J6_9CYAN|nr:hypothetical protein [Scytonema hofmannii]KYC38225.1 hypothetical protein WA1_38445 [Scytonema hofmannii PCC 7110]